MRHQLAGAASLAAEGGPRATKPEQDERRPVELAWPAVAWIHPMPGKRQDGRHQAGQALRAVRLVIRQGQEQERDGHRRQVSEAADRRD